MEDTNVSIMKVQTISPPNKTRSETPTSTPAEVLASFGAKVTSSQKRSLKVHGKKRYGLKMCILFIIHNKIVFSFFEL